MNFRIAIILLLLQFVQLIPLHDERRQIIERVRNYLQKSDIISRKVAMTSPELPNSNKISFGYNLLSGSPVCYTSECQMGGFTRSIFKLNYSSPVQGSCIDKLVPNNVDLDCRPLTSMEIENEMIDTVEKLHTSISNKVQMSVGIKYKNVGFSYAYSKETQYMLDTIVKNRQTSILTKVQISYVKLSMFEPKMELTDNFKYIIENMPCCEDNDPDIEEYVKNFIFDYYGFTYVTSILLGGIAQQHIIIKEGAKERLEQQGVNVKNEASAGFDAATFSVSIDTSITDSQSKSNSQKFQQEIHSNHSNTLGGDTTLSTFTEWSKTIPNNPIVLELAVRDIFHLFTKHYFPDDSLINNKSKLIEKILEKYLARTIYCYKNCGGNGTHGVCEPTAYFQFGICKCKPGWTGSDCETMIEPPKILHGTLCGFDRSFMRVNCEGLRPWEQCPKGWAQYNWPTDLTVCYKNQTEIGNPVHGTLCGLHSYQYGPYPFNHNIGCGNVTNVLNNACPLGYQQYNAESILQRNHFSKIIYGHRNAIFAIMDGKKHLSGTLCGLQIQHTVKGPSCDGYNPGLNQCPSEYVLQYTAFNDLGFMTCVKN